MLARITARLRPAPAASLGPGDDCAVLQTSGRIVVTSDTMIEGPDFRLAWHSGFELGWKLAATNLSDVAAMGADPVGLTVALACPDSTPTDLLEEIARGLDAACLTLAPRCGVIGGDLASAPVLTAAVTAIGELGEREPVLRSGARPGDAVAYTGDLGLAGLGLALLFDRCADAGGAHSEGLAELRSTHDPELAAQLAPSPPIALGAAAAEAGATAMLDVSDSLSLDASRLARASGVAVELDSALLLGGFGEQRGVSVRVEQMLHGGEDHGLLATFPADAVLPDGFARIGAVREAGGHAVLLDGEALPERGWDPFLTRPSG